MVVKIHYVTISPVWELCVLVVLCPVVGCILLLVELIAYSTRVVIEEGVVVDEILAQYIREVGLQCYTLPACTDIETAIDRSKTLLA